ncbi:MAG TPA: hypothetical protein VLF63_03795 [Patescibacteria group bacterium]|nr:hypothetical protein [Patescibacteria group bacterium]
MFKKQTKNTNTGQPNILMQDSGSCDKGSSAFISDNNFRQKICNYRLKRLLVFVLVFGAVGAYIIFKSLAITTTPIATILADQMTLPAGASVVSDPTASTGKAVLLTNRGSLNGTVNLPSSATSFSVLAKAGSQCKGTASLSVKIDNFSAIATTLKSINWTSVSSAFSLTRGTHNLKISFTNANTTCAHTLYLDVTNFYGPSLPPPPVPTVAISATPQIITNGQSSTLNWTSTNANTCVSSGSWSGSQQAQGSQNTGVLSQDSTFTLACTNTSGTATQSVTVTVTPATTNTVPHILYSMESPHEGIPHGVPSSYPWQSQPIVKRPIPPAGWAAVTTWGQIYADATTVEPSNVRVEVKNIECYLWSISSKKWLRTQAYATVVGGHYLEDFSTNSPLSAALRTEPDGGISTTMISGYNFHFYPTARAIIVNPTDIGAVFTTYQARLIVDNPTGPNNISTARYLANVGGDWWKNTTIGYGGIAVNNAGIGQGRFTYLTGSWQAEDFYTGGPVASGLANAWTEAQLQANPPTLDGMGPP